MDYTSSFTPSHSIGGINIKTAEDLKNVPLSDIYLYLNNLAYLNSSYASQITLLLEKIENLEASIKDYRELKFLMDELSNGHISLTCKIDLLIAEFASFKIETIQKLYNLQLIDNQLTPREIGFKSEQHILQFIFPGCQKAPYRIRSFANLMKFIKNPDKAVDKDLCDEEAPAYFNQNPEKTNILSRFNLINSIEPELKGYISDLKDLCYPKCNSFEELLNSNHEDIYTLTALNICRKYYEKTFHISDNLEIK